MTGYAPVDVAEYRIDTTSPGHASSAIYFLTPDGIACNFRSGGAQCTGNNFPAIPPAPSNPSSGLKLVNWIGTSTKLQQTNNPIASDGRALGQQIRTLPPFHTLTVDGATCGVDDKKMAACKDSQGRGFVLSPAWSGWIPKV